MSIATLKKKTQTQYKNMSAGMNGFSLNGTYRNQGYIGQTSLSRSLPRTLMKGNVVRGHGGCCGEYNLATIIRTPEMACLEDNSVVKPSVINTRGMIKTKYKWIDRPAPYISVKPDANRNLNTQGDYVDILARKVIDSNTHTIVESIPSITLNQSFNKLIQDKSPWGIYSAESWNASTNTLAELRGNGRNASGVNVSSDSGSGNGAAVSIPYLYGTTSSTMIWPTGSIPTNFTICSISRYTGPSRSRIFNGYESGFNWLHGHWGGRRGSLFYDGNFMTNNMSVGTLDNWLVCCGKNGSTSPNNVLLDGVASGNINGGGGGGTLTINSSLQYPEYSDWAFSHIFIWDQVLTDEEMVIVSNKLLDYLQNGISFTSVFAEGTGTSVTPKTKCKNTLFNPDRIRKLTKQCWNTKPVEYYSPQTNNEYVRNFKKKCALNNTFFVANNNRNTPYIKTT